MNVELVAQMFKNYQSNVLFHLEGRSSPSISCNPVLTKSSYGGFEGPIMTVRAPSRILRSSLRLGIAAKKAMQDRSMLSLNL